jgi:hypothetical protein
MRVEVKAEVKAEVEAEPEVEVSLLDLEGDNLWPRHVR